MNKGTQFVVPGTEVPGGIPGLQLSVRGVRGQSVACGFGGFHDLVPLDGGRWGLAVGDVSALPQGSGIPASGSIGVARAVMRAMAQIDGTPSAVLAAMNRALVALSPSEHCSLAVTYATVRHSAVGARIRICSAGPQTAFVRRSDGSVRAVVWPGSALGLHPDPELSDARVLLRTGDTVILVSASVAAMLGGADGVCRILAAAGRASAARSEAPASRSHAVPILRPADGRRECPAFRPSEVMAQRRARSGKVTQLWLARLLSARGADKVSAKS